MVAHPACTATMTHLLTNVGGTYIVTNGAWEGEGKEEALQQLSCHHQAEGVDVGVLSTTIFVLPPPAAIKMVMTVVVTKAAVV